MHAVASTRPFHRDEVAPRPPPDQLRCIDAATAARIAGDPPAANALVAQVAEDAAAAYGGKVWLSTLMELLAPFGVGERLMRTCVFRLVRQGTLQTVRDGRRSACGPCAARPDTGAEPRAAAPDETLPWTMVMGWSGRLGGAEQDALRKQLWQDGFRLVAPGVFALPGPPPATLQAALERLGLGRRLWVCQMSELPGTGQLPLSELVGAAWDLAPAIADYRIFIERYAPLQGSVRAMPRLAPRAAFMLRTLLLCDWRRAQRHDPQLPSALLPPDWPGARAAALCRELGALTADGAGRHLAQLQPAAC